MGGPSAPRLIFLFVHIINNIERMNGTAQSLFGYTQPPRKFLPKALPKILVSNFFKVEIQKPIIYTTEIDADQEQIMPPIQFRNRCYRHLTPAQQSRFNSVVAML